MTSVSKFQMKVPFIGDLFGFVGLLSEPGSESILVFFRRINERMYISL